MGRGLAPFYPQFDGLVGKLLKDKIRISRALNQIVVSGDLQYLIWLSLELKMYRYRLVPSGIDM